MTDKEDNLEEKIYDDDSMKSLTNRLNRIEGQVRGIKRMLENNSNCPSILIQVSAVNAALNSFSKVLLADYLKSDILEDLKTGNTTSIDDLLVILQKLMK